MQRRDFLKTTGLLTGLALLPSCLESREAPTAKPTDRPNILFIMSDDHPAQAISAYNGFLAGVHKTPNIDRLAAEGMRFNNCFCTNSICTPSRATILTGKYGHKNGCAHLDETFDGSQQTFPKLLQKAGYYTGVIGKWHLASQPTGFDYYNVLPGQGDYFDPKFKEKDKPWEDGFEGGRVYPGYVTDVTADLVLNFLQNRPKDRPFCLLYHNKAPHDMWDYHDKYARLYENIDIPAPATLWDDYSNRTDALPREDFFKIGRGDLTYEDQTAGLSPTERKKKSYQIFIKSFLRCAASVDENLGRVLAYLDKSHLTKNTIVIYTSDQGYFLGEHGLWDKRFMYEESIRMPFIVRYPRAIKPGTVNNDIITNVDFAETFLDYAGLSIPADMQGRSIKPLLQGRTPADWPKSMYYHYSDVGGGVTTHYGVRTRRYKLICFYGLDTDPKWELFDLENDPHELNNLYNDPTYAKIAKDLKAELRRLRNQLGDTT